MSERIKHFFGEGNAASGGFGSVNGGDISSDRLLRWRMAKGVDEFQVFDGRKRRTFKKPRAVIKVAMVSPEFPKAVKEHLTTSKPAMVELVEIEDDVFVFKIVLVDSH